MTAVAIIWTLCVLSVGFTLGSLRDPARGATLFGAIGSCLFLWAGVGVLIFS